MVPSAPHPRLPTASPRPTQSRAPRAWLAALALGFVLGTASCSSEAPSDPQGDPRSAAAAGAVPLGTRGVDPEVTDRHFLPRLVSELGDATATVLVFTAVGCPLADRYLPRLGDMERAYRGRGVRFLAIDVGAASVLEAVGQAQDFGLDFHVVKDLDGSAAAAFGATRSPQVVLLDGERTLVYRGRVDDQYRFAGARPKPGREDLKEALEDVLSGRAVRVPETPVDGCPLEPERVDGDPSLTWIGGVGELFQRHCAACHEPGAPGPFPLHTFEAVTRRRNAVFEVVQEGRMPPWFAHPDHGRFSNDRSLGSADRQRILAWLAAGAPRGEGVEDPRVEHASTWRMGEPDLVVEGPATEIPADGYVEYQHLLLSHEFETDTWIEAIEVLPSRVSVVHHAQVSYVDKRRVEDPTSDWRSWVRILSIYVPGREVFETPAGTALLVPAGSVLSLQMHYVPDGRAGADRPRIGLRFPKDRVSQRLRTLLVSGFDIQIPPLATAHTIEASRSVGENIDIDVHTLLPHLHLRGRDLDVRAKLPDGRERTLLRVPSFHFDWQIDYQLDPRDRRYPAGTEFRLTARYDNSPFNALNPDPHRMVGFGEETQDEMCYLWLFYTAAGENLAVYVDPLTGAERVAAPRPEPRPARRTPQPPREPQ